MSHLVYWLLVKCGQIELLPIKIDTVLRCTAQNMPVIELSTLIRAPRTLVFDLARSIDAHQFTAAGTSERAIAGVTQGLIGLGGIVTWQARHFGITQTLTVCISAYDRPRHFQDVMTSGIFKSMAHDHHFEENSEGTLMKDRFEFSSPWGILGKIAERLFLTGYMRRFIIHRNTMMKQIAESGEWHRYVPREEPPSSDGE